MVHKSPYKFPFYDLAMVSKFPYMVRFMDNKFFYESIIFSYYGNIWMKERALPYLIRFMVSKFPWMVRFMVSKFPYMTFYD